MQFSTVDCRILKQWQMTGSVAIVAGVITQISNESRLLLRLSVERDSTVAKINRQLIVTLLTVNNQL